MSRPKHITVTAPPGRRTPVHDKDGVEPGGGQLFVTEDDVARIQYSQTTIRSINRGDLVACNMDGTPVASVDLAASTSESEEHGVKWPTAKKRALLEAERVKENAEAKKPDPTTLDKAPAAPKKGGPQ
jgi:hypothetical protein